MTRPLLEIVDDRAEHDAHPLPRYLASAVHLTPDGEPRVLGRPGDVSDDEEARVLDAWELAYAARMLTHHRGREVTAEDWRAVEESERAACSRCGGRGEYLLLIERPGGPPGNQVVSCECRKARTAPAPERLSFAPAETGHDASEETPGARGA